MASIIPLLLAICLTLPFAAGDLSYQGAQAPPPAPSNCEGWCPKWSCCKLCDDPACSGCGAVRQCAGGATSPVAASATSLSGLAQAQPMPAATSSAAPIMTAPGFQTGFDGRLMANGKPFLIKGVNWWGTEGPTRVFGGLKQRSMDGLLDFIVEQGFNAIRILVSHHAVMINGKIPASEYDEGRTPELVNMRYLDQIELMLRKAADRRLLVMVNAHRTVADAWPGEGLWYDDKVSEANVIRSWTVLANTLCPHWNAFAADLVNEPRKGSWGRGSSNDWNKAAERIGDAVLDACPRLLIFVQGVAGEPGAQGDEGAKGGYFWGENLHGVHTAPVRLKDQSKLVYSPHTYGPGTVRQQSYFPTCTGGGCAPAADFPANMEAIWDRHFGFVAELTKHAVVLGEFGGVYTSYDRAWQDAFMTYLIKKGFGGFYFGLNPDSDDTGGLLRHDWRTPEAAKLELLKRMPATSVIAIIGEDPPSPLPPTIPPPPPPPPPSPLFSDSLMEMFQTKPPPPRPPPRRPPAFAAQRPYSSSVSSKYHTQKLPQQHVAPIILGGAQLKLGSGSSAPKEQDGAHSTPTVSSTSVTHMIVAFLVPFGLVAVATRYNPKLRERLPFGSGRKLHPALHAVPSAALSSVRPRQPGPGPVYDRVAAAEPSSYDEEEHTRSKERASIAMPKPKPASKPAPKPKLKQQEAHEAPSIDAGSGALEVTDQDHPGLVVTSDKVLTPGMQVRIHSLQGAREHNGKEGVLIAPVATQSSGTRWNLRLLTGELLALKPENLRPCGGRAAPSMHDMVAALERAGEYEKADMLRAVLPERV